VVSPQILHKSDLGGIALNLADELSVTQAVIEMQDRIGTAAPEAVIEGYLVEKMAPKGLELIIGMRRDPTFGPLMMFGLGGVVVELFKDVGFGIAPLSPEQAQDMIEATRAGKLLKGFRGGPVYDLDAVVDVIGRLSQIALDHPSIAEVEVNPLLVLPEGQGALVLDARMILDSK
jgi:acetyltransferase